MQQIRKLSIIIYKFFGKKLFLLIIIKFFYLEEKIGNVFKYMTLKVLLFFNKKSKLIKTFFFNYLIFILNKINY